MKIIVVRYQDEENGEIRVDYGVNSETLENIVLPNELWQLFKSNCVFDNTIQEWILKV